MHPLFYFGNEGLIQSLFGPNNLNSQCHQLLILNSINQQFQLTQSLLQVQAKLAEQLKKDRSSSESSQASSRNNRDLTKKNSTGEIECPKFKYEQLEDSPSNEQKIKELEPLTRLRRKEKFKYEFESEEQKQNFKKCETKNIVKNFMKAIFSYARKYPEYIRALSCRVQIEFEMFMKFLEQMQDEVTTIFELREIWETHSLSRTFRILSSNFLRKYSLKHVFHSRIFNYSIHLKYRNKLLQGVQEPSKFTRLKQF